MKSTAFCLVFFVSVLVFSQEPDLRHVTTDSCKADFYIQLEDKKVKYVDTLFYHWFKSQKVHVTQGFASGYLLTGVYTAYFFSGQMLERGTFDNGLKTGEWKIWYESGQLQSIMNYDEGLLSGNFFRYNEAGKLIESGSYKSGKFHGEIIENGIVTEYKNGRRKEEKAEKDAATESDKPEKMPLFKKQKDDSTEEPVKDDGEKKFSLKKIFQKKSPEEKEKKPKEKSEKDKEKRKSNSNEVAEDKDKRG